MCNWNKAGESGLLQIFNRFKIDSCYCVRIRHLCLRLIFLLYRLRWNSYMRCNFRCGKHGKIDPVGTDEIDPVKTA